jgi:hypothetical protein
MGCGSSTSAQPAKQPTREAETTAPEREVGYSGDAAKASVEKADGTLGAGEQVCNDEGGQQAALGSHSSLPPIKDAIGANRKAPPPDSGAQEIAQLFLRDALDQDENATDVDSNRHDAGEKTGRGADSRRSHDRQGHTSSHHHHQHRQGHKHGHRDEKHEGGSAEADERYAGRLLMLLDTAAVSSSLSLSMGSFSNTILQACACVLFKLYASPGRL